MLGRAMRRDESGSAGSLSVENENDQQRAGEMTARSRRM